MSLTSLFFFLGRIIHCEKPPSLRPLCSLLVGSCHKTRSDPGFLIDVAIFQINLLFSVRSSSFLCAWLFGGGEQEQPVRKWKAEALDMTECRLVSFTTYTNKTLCCFSEFVCFSGPDLGKKWDNAGTEVTTFSFFFSSVIYPTEKTKTSLWNKALHLSYVYSFSCPSGGEVRI